MGELKRNVIDVQHPGQIADVARQLSGTGPSTVPFYEQANYVDDDGNPLTSIPDPGPQPGDFDTPAINSPRNMEQFMARSAAAFGGRRGSRDTQEALQSTPEQTVPTLQPEGDAGNLVHLDDGFAHLDGQFVPLNELDLARIGTIVIKALDRKMKEDFARLKDAYSVQSRSRKRAALQPKRRARRKALPTTPAVPPGEPTESA
jgi:hypothetical protein